MQDLVLASLRSAQAALAALLANEPALTAITAAGAQLVRTFQGGGRVYSCGNGGSMCDAMHFAEELSGKFRGVRPPLPALAISDAAHLSCTANDFGFDAVFGRFLEAHGRKGDTLLAISTSGTSPNILAAATAARRAGMHVVALTGRPASPLAALADVDICTPGGTAYSDRVQELHIKVIHTLIELCERQLFAASAR